MEQEVALEVRQAERGHEKMELGNSELAVIMK